NNAPKYVAPTTLTHVDEWQNSTLIGADVEATVNRLTTELVGTITGQCSPSLIRYLLTVGLLDELTLSIHPVVAGTSKRLFSDQSPLTRMDLVDSRITGRGVAILTYRPRRGE